MRALWSRVRRTLPIRVGRRYLGRNGANQATLIAWNLLFAIFPIVLLAVTAAGLVFRDPAVGREVAKAVAALLPAGRGSVVLSALRSFHRHSGAMAVVGIVGLVWSGTSLFGAMEQGFAALSGAKTRGFIPQKLMSVGMTVLFTVLAGPVVLSSSLLAALKALPGLPGFVSSGPLALIVQMVLGVVVGTILFTAIYHLVPHRRGRLRASALGGVIAAVVFEALSLLFPLYFHLEHGFSSYGSTFGLFFLILAYVFLVAQITVLGYAVVVEAGADRSGAGGGTGTNTGTDTGPDLSGPILAVPAETQPGSATSQ
ncbi:MAG: YihY/virulence factor BrkB family protein [Candidatus Dormibacteria bacterium]